jgi:hypothetical protein
MDRPRIETPSQTWEKTEEAVLGYIPAEDHPDLATEDDRPFRFFETGIQLRLPFPLNK